MLFGLFKLLLFIITIYFICKEILIPFSKGNKLFPSLTHFTKPIIIDDILPNKPIGFYDDVNIVVSKVELSHDIDSEFSALKAEGKRLKNIGIKYLSELN